MLAKLADIPGFLRFVVTRWREDRCPQVAGSLTYTTLLALAPAFAIGVALLSSAPFFHEVMDKFRIFLRGNLAPEVADTIITTYLPQFAHNAKRLGSLSVVAVLVVAVWMLLIVDNSLNVIWGTRQARPYWVSALGYAALILAAPLLIGVSVTLTTRLTMLSNEVTGSSGGLHAASLRLVSTAITTLAFFLVYRIIPHQKVPWRHALLGGFVAALFFEAAKELFAVYVKISPTYSRVYGPFATVPLFLVWLYFSWLVVLLGAELTAGAAYWRGRRWKATRRGPRLAEAIAIAQVLRGASAALPFEEIAQRTKLPHPEVEEALAQMVDAGLAHRHGRDGFELAPATRESLAQQSET